MLRIPFYSVEDLERSRREMDAFRKERKLARDEMVIVAVKCQTCGQMLMVEAFGTHNCEELTLG
jgi:hypothetical protein